MLTPIPKIKAMILFFANHTDPRLLGKVKLMKLFYFADFAHVKKHGAPITYDNYVHLEHGPIPSTIMNLVDAAETDTDNAILSDSIAIEVKETSLQKRIIPLRKFSEKDAKYFSENELSAMETICQRFYDKNAKFIEDASHKEAAWKKTSESESIPYALAAEDPDCLVDKETIELSLRVMGN